MSNDEYDEMAKIAFGVMGVESQFGEGLDLFPDGFSLKNFLNPRRHKEKFAWGRGGLSWKAFKSEERRQSIPTPDRED